MKIILDWISISVVVIGIVLLVFWELFLVWIRR